MTLATPFPSWPNFPKQKSADFEKKNGPCGNFWSLGNEPTPPKWVTSHLLLFFFNMLRLCKVIHSKHSSIVTRVKMVTPTRRGWSFSGSIFSMSSSHFCVMLCLYTFYTEKGTMPKKNITATMKKGRLCLCEGIFGIANLQSVFWGEKKWGVEVYEFHFYKQK